MLRQKICIHLLFTDLLSFFSRIKHPYNCAITMNYYLQLRIGFTGLRNNSNIRQHNSNEVENVQNLFRFYVSFHTLPVRVQRGCN
jgi:hypothetical protein